MTDRTDEQLVAASRQGDSEAYGELTNRFSRQVFGLCLGAVGNVHDAEDLVQETFIRGYTKIARLREPKNFRAWIKRIARNLCLDFFRRQKPGEILVADPPAQIGRAPAVRAEHIDLKRAIARLPEALRVPVVHYYFEGRSMASVAADLAICPASVRGRLHRARRELRRLMTEPSKSLRDTRAQ